MLKYKQIAKKDKCSVERDSAGLEAVNLDLAHSPASTPPPLPLSSHPSGTSLSRTGSVYNRKKPLFFLGAYCHVFILFPFFSHSPSLKEGESGVQAKTHRMFLLSASASVIKRLSFGLFLFLLVFGTALLRRSSNGWLLVFHSGIRK